MTWVGEIRDGIKAFLDARKWWQSRNKQTVTDRFFLLFESHGIHRNQIPRFIGHGLTLADVQNSASLMPKLTEPMLHEVCERFAIRREWLDCADERIYTQHYFYPSIGGFDALLDRLIATNSGAQLDGVLIAPLEMDHSAEALLVVREKSGWIGGSAVYRYHLCGTWAFSYWKARVYLTACIASAWKRKVYVHGIRAPKDHIQKLASGLVLLPDYEDSLWPPGFRRWHPEKMALEPEEFLKGIDPEENRFGIISGLEWWLDFESQGMMDTNLNYKVRQQFEDALARER